MIHSSGKGFKRIEKSHVNKKKNEQIENAYDNVQQNIRAKKIDVKDTKLHSQFARQRTIKLKKSDIVHSNKKRGNNSKLSKHAHKSIKRMPNKNTRLAARVGSMGLNALVDTSSSINDASNSSEELSTVSAKYATDSMMKYSAKAFKYTHQKFRHYKNVKKIANARKQLSVSGDGNVIINQGGTLKKAKLNYSDKFSNKSLHVKLGKKKVTKPNIKHEKVVGLRKSAGNNAIPIKSVTLQRKITTVKIGKKKLKKIKNKIQRKNNIKNIAKFGKKSIGGKIENSMEGRETDDLGSTLGRKVAIQSIKYGGKLINIRRRKIRKSVKNIKKVKVTIKKKPMTIQQLNNKLLQLYQQSSTFSYMQDPKSFNSYQYKPKPKKPIQPHKSGLSGKIDKGQVINTKNKSIKQTRKSIVKAENSIASKRQSIKGANKLKKKKTPNIAYRKPKIRANIGGGRPTFAKGVNKVFKTFIKGKSGITAIILAASLLIGIIFSVMIPATGVVVVYEGYAVVVEFVEDATEEVTSFFGEIGEFVGSAWDDAITSIKTKFTDTHGAGKVSLDDIVSVDTFIKGMVGYEYSKIEKTKQEYTDNGYSVTLINYENVLSSSGEAETVTDGQMSLNGASKSVAEKIWKMIRNEGYNAYATAGILGNMIQESTLVPDRYNSTRKYYGLIQWSPTRTKNLKKFCMKKSKDFRTVEGQVLYLLQYEMPGYYSGNKLQEFKNSTSIDVATNSFRSIVEGTDSAKDARVGYAIAANILFNNVEITAESDNSEEPLQNTSYSYSVAYDEDSFFYIMKPLWLSVMYGKYEYEPTELEMSNTAENIADILSGFTVTEEPEAKTVTICVAQGGADEVLAEYYMNDINELKGKASRTDKEEQELQKLLEDYEMALTLLDYYNCDADGSGATLTDLSNLTELSSNEKINKMITLAKSKIGNKYVYGGTSIDTGIDCSAFVQWCYKQIGISLHRTSRDQCNSDGVEVSISDIKPGDLCFYCSAGTTTVSHVAMYIGNGTVIHASNSKPYPKGGIKTSPVTYRTPYKIKRIVTVNE